MAPPGYVATPGYGYGAPQTESKAVVALVLAICSFVVCPVVPAIVALVLARGSERDILASGGRLTGLGMVKAARIISWIHLALMAVVVVGIVIIIAIAAGTSTSP